MEQLKMHSLDNVEYNIKNIGKLFPNCITEKTNEDGKIELAIDFDILKQELSNEVVEGNQERYQFTWPDKKKSMLLANSPIAKTLRPCKEESIDFDNTENLYIEGDNLEVLKLLQETYLGKIKMIYIDPPYNTGNDFVYEDDFSQNSSDYLENSGQFDAEGNRLVKNLESNGRYHTDWLNMIYPRLKLAKNLLADDGVIFISIDDNEFANLEKICNEIFGVNNFIANIIWERAYAPVNLKKHFSENHDFILCYAKNVLNVKNNGLKRSTEANNRYSNPDNDPRGVWQSDNFSVGPAIEKNIYKIISPSGRENYPPNGYSWRVSEEKFNQMLKEKRVWFGENGSNTPRQKRFLSEVKNTITPLTIWKYKEVGHSQDATKELKKLFDDTHIFDYSKPTKLIKRCLELYSDKDSIVLDFFSGSATTAHATMQLNEDGGNRKFILVQLPEITSEKSEANKAGYKNICEIGKERIRRAGKKIKEESPLTTQDLDIGFRVLKCDSTNMKDVYYRPEEYEADLFDSVKDNIKGDRTSEDLLFQVMLDLGVLLSSKIQEKTIEHKKVYNVADGYLIACFDENITENTIIEIAKQKPYYCVLRDSSLDSDNVLTNFDQIFKTYSPDTIRKVL